MIFLFIALLCVVIEAFFSMFEMACVSFDKVRLTYYVSKKSKKAIWLDHLLKKPSRLFGTTLIVVNTVLQIGSEASRRFYEYLGLNPDFSPLTQFVLVVVFGELIPLFAARRYFESIALFDIPFFYFLSKAMLPLTWFVDTVSRIVGYLFGKKSSSQYYLTKEEIQRAFEHQGKPVKDVNVTTVNNIFLLKNFTAKNIMQSISTAFLMPSDFFVDQAKSVLFKNFSPYVLVYHNSINNIISVVMTRDLLRLSSKDLVKNSGFSPWFVTENMPVLTILKQFKINNQTVAIVLDRFGKSVGVISLEMILTRVFGDFSVKSHQIEDAVKLKRKKEKVFIEKTFSGDTLIVDFNKKFKVDLTIPSEDIQTLGDLVKHLLGQHPSVGDVVYVENFEFIIKKPGFWGAKKILVRNLN